MGAVFRSSSSVRPIDARAVDTTRRRRVLRWAEAIEPILQAGTFRKNHKDGGALAMKVYGNHRDQHSMEMAQKVTFSRPQPENVVQMPEQNTGAVSR